MKRHLLAIACGAIALLATAAPALASTTINTFPSWDGSSEVSDFGYPDTATYGQTVQAPLGEPALKSFTFELDVPSTTVFRAEVYAWDGSEATGPALYESGSMTTSGSGLQPVTINTGGIPVVAGAEYVLFLSVSKSVGSGSGGWGFISSDAYGGGGFVYQNNGSDPSAWTGVAWSSFGALDLAFTAVFGTPGVSGPHEACWNDLGTDGCNQLPRVAVCDPLTGFQDIELRERNLPAYKDDPAAAYVQGYGLMCALSDLFTYGGDPSQYKDAAYKVDNTGTQAPTGIDQDAFGAFYEYFAHVS